MSQLITINLSKQPGASWGFRLQGGKDFAQPLGIQKVNVGSVAEQAGVQVGDAIVSIGGVDAISLRHKEAQDAIVRAGNSFQLVVQRGSTLWKPKVTPLAQPAPTPQGPVATKTSLIKNAAAKINIGSSHNTSPRPFPGPGTWASSPIHVRTPTLPPAFSSPSESTPQPKNNFSAGYPLESKIEYGDIHDIRSGSSPSFSPSRLLFSRSRLDSADGNSEVSFDSSSVLSRGVGASHGYSNDITRRLTSSRDSLNNLHDLSYASDSSVLKNRCVSPPFPSPPPPLQSARLDVSPQGRSPSPGAGSLGIFQSKNTYTNLSSSPTSASHDQFLNPVFDIEKENALKIEGADISLDKENARNFLQMQLDKERARELYVKSLVSSKDAIYEDNITGDRFNTKTRKYSGGVPSHNLNNSAVVDKCLNNNNSKKHFPNRSTDNIFWKTHSSELNGNSINEANKSSEERRSSKVSDNIKLFNGGRRHSSFVPPQPGKLNFKSSTLDRNANLSSTSPSSVADRTSSTGRFLKNTAPRETPRNRWAGDGSLRRVPFSGSCSSLSNVEDKATMSGSNSNVPWRNHFSELRRKSAVAVTEASRSYSTSPTPKVNGTPIVNPQYNSPINLYNEDSIAEALSAQSEVLGKGCLGVNFMKKGRDGGVDLDSDVLRMVQEMDRAPKTPPVASGTNSVYCGAASPSEMMGTPEVPVQSASFKILERYLSGDEAGSRPGSGVSSPVPGSGPVVRSVQAPVTRPRPEGEAPGGATVCAQCDRPIVGVFVRIRDKNLHSDCFRCNTCGSSLKNVGYYNVNDKLYCDVHAKQAAKHNPPGPNMVPYTVKPGAAPPAGALSAPVAKAPAAKTPAYKPSSPGVRIVPAPNFGISSPIKQNQTTALLNEAFDKLCMQEQSLRDPPATYDQRPFEDQHADHGLVHERDIRGPVGEYHDHVEEHHAEERHVVEQHEHVQHVQMEQHCVTQQQHHQIFQQQEMFHDSGFQDSYASAAPVAASDKPAPVEAPAPVAEEVRSAPSPAPEQPPPEEPQDNQATGEEVPQETTVLPERPSDAAVVPESEVQAQAIAESVLVNGEETSLETVAPETKTSGTEIGDDQPSESGDLSEARNEEPQQTQNAVHDTEDSVDQAQESVNNENVIEEESVTEDAGPRVDEAVELKEEQPTETAQNAPEAIQEVAAQPESDLKTETEEPVEPESVVRAESEPYSVESEPVAEVEPEFRVSVAKSIPEEEPEAVCSVEESSEPQQLPPSVQKPAPPISSGVGTLPFEMPVYMPQLASSLSPAPTSSQPSVAPGGSSANPAAFGAPSGGINVRAHIPKKDRRVAGLSYGPEAPLCCVCRKVIRGPFVTALGKNWCPDHFHCATDSCRKPLIDVGFVEEQGNLYCEDCYEKFLAPTCGKCDKRIKGDCLNAVGKQFHPECFCCTYCGKVFGSGAFYLEDGLPYCETDWNDLFTTKCVGCGFPIEAGDRWVEALNNNYHSQCFKCSKCHKNLEGQSFFAKGGKPFCKAHAQRGI
ncbi:PDZ and LIM domain protein Zasp isoform X15 [Hyalella azteca]|uniref:PDZ and LIM domain protein Zasp isoform X15 n=1 Tax=Hyalella azteca TaxID=294128 RepID=A0A979FFG5_HYAAZ|nr:PDZ and LIM domain protein Zasp isoform X15 [Hyalella azteca]